MDGEDDGVQASSSRRRCSSCVPCFIPHWATSYPCRTKGWGEGERGWESLGSNSYSVAIDGIGGTKPMERTGLTCDQYECAHLAHTPRHIFYKLGKGPEREGGGEIV